MSRVVAVILLFFILMPPSSNGAPAKASDVDDAVSTLDKPLYSPFVERYVLDELKQLRIDQASTKQELIQQIVDREHQSVDRAVTYATDTVTYFFYLIAGATSILLLVGWTSIRDMKERVHSLADEEISKLISEYEQRLATIETELQRKTQHIEENREEIELSREIQSLWLRAQQESSATNKINVYDEILKLRHDDGEALTYKADAVLELNEPKWAANLCKQALAIDPENSHALYQLACAYALLGRHESAIECLQRAIGIRASYATDAETEAAFQALRETQDFHALVHS